MRQLRFVVPVLLFTLCAGTTVRTFAGEPETVTIGAEQQKKGGSGIKGTVIDIDSRAPIDGAIVEVLGSDKRTTAGKDGQFSIRELGEGYYQLRASAPGFDPQTQNNLFVGAEKYSTAFFMLKKSGASSSAAADHSSPVPTATKSPSYPPEARKNGVEGIFFFNVEISESGSISSVECFEKKVHAENGKLKDKEVTEKFPQQVNQLEKEALESIWQWKFKPAMKDGKPIPSKVVLPVKFKLNADDHKPKE